MQYKLVQQYQVDDNDLNLKDLLLSSRDFSSSPMLQMMLELFWEPKLFKNGDVKSSKFATANIFTIGQLIPNLT
jgi:hypothetical protein